MHANSTTAQQRRTAAHTHKQQWTIRRERQKERAKTPAQMYTAQTARASPTHEWRSHDRTQQQSRDGGDDRGGNNRIALFFLL
jgi:hypothetical protein